ncbi:MAG: hypothetical protein Q7S51_05065 [Gallionellaceae bacterium]|nr:hypothetical protein [Gallionellaceae bacterium]
MNSVLTSAKKTTSGLKLELTALLFVTAIGFTPMAFADPTCATEITAIQAELNAPAASISPDNLQQAWGMFKVLTEDCVGGTPFETAAPIAHQIRSLLGMGEAQ